jgi:hypothetical protein
MGSTVEAAERLLDAGIEHTQARRFGAAGQRFLEALAALEALPPGADRSRLLGRAAHSFQSAGHPDLALMALQDNLDSAQSKDDPGRRCADLITLASSWIQLGQAAAGVTVNQAALDHALAHHRWADAASASTNLAGQAANRGDLSGALNRLQASLGWLALEALPDTDAITRLHLIQVVDAAQAPPEIALDAATDLFDRLHSYVGLQRWRGVAPAFHRLVERWLSLHPQPDADGWKRNRFPRVFGEAGS